jgi:hypothetical protein
MHANCASLACANAKKGVSLVKDFPGVFSRRCESAISSGDSTLEPFIGTHSEEAWRDVFLDSESDVSIFMVRKFRHVLRPASRRYIERGFATYTSHLHTSLSFIHAAAT